MTCALNQPVSALCISKSLFSFNTFLVFLFCQKNIKLTEILDLSTLVFSGKAFWTCRFQTFRFYSHSDFIVIHTFGFHRLCRINIKLTEILDLSTLVFSENKACLDKFYASWVPILSTRLRGGTLLKDPAYRRLSIHARREDSKTEALNPRCKCQEGQTGDQQVVLRVPLSQQLSHNSAANNRKFEAQIDPLHYPRYKHPDRYWRGTQFS